MRDLAGYTDHPRSPHFYESYPPSSRTITVQSFLNLPVHGDVHRSESLWIPAIHPDHTPACLVQASGPTSSYRLNDASALPLKSATEQHSERLDHALACAIRTFPPTKDMKSCSPSSKVGASIVISCVIPVSSVICSGTAVLDCTTV